MAKEVTQVFHVMQVLRGLSCVALTVVVYNVREHEQSLQV